MGAVMETSGLGWSTVNGKLNWRCLPGPDLATSPPSTLQPMAWFASLFSSSKASIQGRRKVLSSTQEAFSLPSPVFAQNGLFTADSSLSSPDPESAITPSYTYPPPSAGAQYKYISTGCANFESFLTFPSALNHVAESHPVHNPHPCYPSIMPRSLPLLNTHPSSKHGPASEIGCRPNIPN
jgi:hypothetical protein